jgi:hypothetical protein
VVADGVAEVEPEVNAVWLPGPLSMLKEVAPVTDHESVDDLPGEMLDGEAVKEEMAGTVPVAGGGVLPLAP